MTVIVWDGKTLAADRQVDSGGRRRYTRKIYKVRGHLVGFAGCAAAALAFIEWFKDGADIARYPCVQADRDKGADVVVITPDRRILVWEAGAAAAPIPFDGTTIAEGSGSQAAMGALAVGAALAVEVSARMAVEAANRVCVGCDGGVDELTFDDPDEP